MKRMLTIICLMVICYLALIYGYRFYGKGHNYKYTISSNDEIEINEIFNNSKESANYYFEVKIKDDIFDFQTYENFNKKSKIIKNVYNYSDEKYTCMLPIFVGNKIISDILCLNKENNYLYYYNNLKGMNTDLDAFADSLIETGYNVQNWIDNSDYKEENNIKYYSDNLDTDDYILVTNYKGVLLTNKKIKKINNINLFTSDVYAKKIDFVYQNKYVVADYTKKFRFHEFYVIDIVNGTKTVITSSNEISFDSYIQGMIDDKVYLFDKSSKKQYEFNMKNNTIKEIGNETTGVKIYNNETNDWNKVPAIKAVNEELLFTKNSNNESAEGYTKVDKMGDDKQGYYFYYKKVDDKYLVYRANNQNKSQLTYLFTTSKIDDIIYFSDSVYFVDGEFIKRYSDKQGVRNIISYNELKFNDNLYFYVYKK